MLEWIVGFVLALLWANTLEWTAHKYVLHGLGRNRRSFWTFHWGDHHRAARKKGFGDPDYETHPFRWNAQGKEVLSLAFLFLMSLPFLWISMGFVAGSWLSIASYYYLHRRAHLYPSWGRRWMPWHYDHHMGPDQDQNWCVVWPFMDWMMGTRVHWIGTEKEAKQWEKIVASQQASKRSDNPLSAAQGVLQASSSAPLNLKA